MSIYSIARQWPICLVLAFGSISLIDAAMAQQTEEVTVVAPREVTREQIGRSSTTGAPIENISVSEQIAYKDLDLKKPADVDELNRRVKEAAEDGCSELDQMLPFTRSDTTHRDCVRKATKSASAQVDAAVASAKAYGGNGP